MYQYSVTQWIFGKEDMETSFKRLKSCGYDGIELGAEPYDLDRELASRLMKKYGLCCTSLCGIFTRERDLSSSDQAVSSHAKKYLRDSIDMAHELGAKLIIVVPSPVGKMEPDSTYEEAWENAAANIREVADYALRQGIILAVEAINRYETYLVNNLSLALRFVEQIDKPAVKLMADLFHMNLEERNNVETIQKIAPKLVHVHIADNTREAAGYGQTDFGAVMRALHEMQYSGSITMEFLPRISNPYVASGMDKNEKLYDDYAQKSIDTIKQCVEAIKI